MAVRRIVQLVGALAVGPYVAMLSMTLLDARTPEPWKCRIELHQGDIGGLEFSLMGDDLTGGLTVGHGADSTTTTTIEGAWTTNVIHFTRVLPSSEVQPFVGIAVRAEDGKVRMAGRFASGFEGIWSATCPTDVDAPRGGSAGLAGPNRGGRHSHSSTQRRTQW